MRLRKEGMMQGGNGIELWMEPGGRSRLVILIVPIRESCTSKC